MYKVRIGSSDELVSFGSRSQIFDWVRDTQSRLVCQTTPCVFSVLTYEHGELESMDRWCFDGDNFVMENIIS
jgi:hypothetical protein